LQIKLCVVYLPPANNATPRHTYREIFRYFREYTQTTETGQSRPGGAVECIKSALAFFLPNTILFCIKPYWLLRSGCGAQVCGVVRSMDGVVCSVWTADTVDAPAYGAVGRCNLHVDWEEGRDLRAVGHEECGVRLRVAGGHDNHRGAPFRTQPPLGPVDHASAESQPRARRVH
jgi:hypothetical protein